MVFVVWNQWFTVHQLQRHNVVPVEDPGSIRWEKSGVGWLKCNVDAAFVVGTGLCFRDTNGQFVAGLTQLQQSVYYML
jgi:hypothetical protein